MSPRASTQPFRQHRHSDPPLLWMAIVLGSILLHGLAFWTIRLNLRSQVTLQTQSPSVDFIEVEAIVESLQPPPGPIDTPKTVSPKPAKSVTIATPQPTRPSQPSKQTVPTPKPFIPKLAPRTTQVVKSVPITQLQQPIPVKPARGEKNLRIAKPVSTSRPSPTKRQTTQKPLPSRSQPVAQKPVRSPSSPRPAPKPPQQPIPSRSQPVAQKPVRSPSNPRPAPKPPQQPIPSRSQPQPAPKPPQPTVGPKPVPKPQPQPPTPSPSQPKPSPTLQTPYPTPQIPHPPQATPTPQPVPSPVLEPDETGAIATIDAGSIRTGTRDIPDTPAQPKQKQREVFSILSQLLLKPSSAIALDVRLEIDETGKLTAIKAVHSLLEGDRGERLAQLLFQDWEFKPAYTGGQPVYSELWLRVTIQPL